MTYDAFARIFEQPGDTCPLHPGATDCACDALAAAEAARPQAYRVEGRIEYRRPGRQLGQWYLVAAVTTASGTTSVEEDLERNDPAESPDALQVRALDLLLCRFDLYGCEGAAGLEVVQAREAA